MKGDEFISAAQLLVRTSTDWRTEIALHLSVDLEAVETWIRADETPPWVDAKMTELSALQVPSLWPRDEWLMGFCPAANGHERQYIVHMAPPRFAARLVDCNEYGIPSVEEEPVDASTGIVYRAGPDTLFCEIDWIDQPEFGQIPKLLHAAVDAILEMDERIS